MKKKLWLVLAVALMLLVASPALAEDWFGVVYNNSSVNLRQEPSQYSTWLGSYASGEWVQIHFEDGNWYYVTGPDGKNGYMSKNYIDVNTPRYGVVGVVSNDKPTAYLNLRAAPSYGATVVDIYYNGVPCVLLSQSNGWYHVRVDGVDGYFREEYITRYSYAYSEEVATIVTPNNTGLNLRSGPGMNYASMGLYNGGGYAMVLQKGNGWWKVSIDGKVGYMKTDFLQDGVLKPTASQLATGSSNSTPVNTRGAYAVVTNPKATQVLNLRAQPNTASKVLGQYRNGAKLTVLGQGTEWCQVRDSAGNTGYMMTQFLTLHNLPTTPTMQVEHPQRTFVNLRNKPSMLLGGVLTRMPHGQTVTVLAPSSNGWVKVYYNGHTGYAVDYFLD
ncbi:MAG: SH3 domain-containing protein [Clostridia bacterium]|nr:SH3 domain-containing protein [Clostridia bacterium]MBQ7865299.1 SH3 domain-containing protein [Clostridia bacterium]